MAKGKEKDELFEVFRRIEAVRQGAKREAPEEVPEEAEEEEKLLPGGKPPVSVAFREPAHRFSIGRKSQIILSLSFNACIGLAVGFVLFCGLVYGISFWLGKQARPKTIPEIRSTVEKEPGPLDLARERRPEEPTPPAVGDYALRIISYGAGQEDKVQDVLQFLEEQGVPRLKWVRTQDGRFIVVYSGPYPDREDPHLKELQEKVRGLLFKGREDFKDANIVRLVRRG
ncbi:MAG: hypothetical protein AMS15_02585 [Planctomycetes bacterium DG_23]|nr:MAG: hypothetical protein AMS15_02585 [Planctomycetes bacterium DG_23]